MSDPQEITNRNNDNHDDADPEHGADAEPDEGEHSGWKLRDLNEHHQSEKQNNDGHVERGFHGKIAQKKISILEFQKWSRIPWLGMEREPAWEGFMSSS